MTEFSTEYRVPVQPVEDPAPGMYRVTVLWQVTRQRTIQTSQDYPRVPVKGDILFGPDGDAAGRYVVYECIFWADGGSHVTLITDKQGTS